MDAADFYSGLVADLYGPLKSAHEQREPYERFIAESGEPALELGCGDGEPMLDLRWRESTPRPTCSTAATRRRPAMASTSS
ncbi:MAG: hypothetical protein ACRDMV_22030, partial [Streptosporangiales bacterium]